jgi:hypothetical protein
MRWLIQRCGQNRLAFILALAAVLAVSGWRLVVLRQQTIPGEDWRKMPQELGSVIFANFSAKEIRLL